MILAGDIGGTKTRLAFFTTDGERIKSLVEETFLSREYSSLDEIVRTFVARHQLSPTYASFGVAGPVIAGRCETTNLPWIIDAHQLATQLGIASVTLLNDLEANAHGVAMLQAEDFCVLNQGAAEAKGNAAIIAAGTGLGEAGFYWDGARHYPFASEGGHADFAPRNDLEAELLRYLLRQFAHVSYERVVSGPGLYNIYQFLRDTGRGGEPAWLTDELRQKDPAATISQAALAGRSDLCVQALDLFVSLYGAEAGNLALKVMAAGGVYVGGGIAPKIIEKLTDSTFMQAFVAKGRMQPLLEAMPVRVILNDRTALLGATRYALLHALSTQQS
jgi:glucokinase